MSQGKQEPLYRKVNTLAHGVHHRFGGKTRSRRWAVGDSREQRRGMAQGVQRGLDYTPLYRFLLSRVGEDWDTVHGEAVKRLDKEEPIFHIVALRRENGTPVVRTGESTYFSGLFVDENNHLQIVAPEIGPASLDPLCRCCTHTLNGKPFTRPFVDRDEKQS